MNSRVLAIARMQDGVVTRAQALAAGMTPSALRHATRPKGPWQRLLPAVYGAFTGPLGQIHRLRAATLYAGDGSMITGPAGCAMLGLRYGPPTDGIVHVLVPEPRQRVDAKFVRIYRTTRLPRPVRWFDPSVVGESNTVPPWWEDADPLAPSARPGEIDVAPASRVVVDTVRKTVISLRDARAVMCEAVQRNRCSVDELAHEVAAAPRAGTAVPRRVMDDIKAGCRSGPECDMRDVVRSSRILPEPRWNRPLPGCARLTPDGCWPEARLVVEVDGKEWHGFRDAPARTEERRALYAQLGWIVVPVSPTRLRQQPDVVRVQLEAAYLAGLRLVGARAH